MFDPTTLKKTNNQNNPNSHTTHDEGINKLSLLESFITAHKKLSNIATANNSNSLEGNKNKAQINPEIHRISGVNFLIILHSPARTDFGQWPLSIIDYIIPISGLMSVKASVQTLLKEHH